MYTYGNVVAGEVEFPLQKLVVEFESLASPDSGRTDDGEMHVVFIRERIRKLKCTLPPMTQAQVSKALDAVLGKKYFIYYVDPIDGLHTIKVYTSAGSAELYNARLYGGLWTGITFNAIELLGDGIVEDEEQ
jgi:hypothetical protein